MSKSRLVREQIDSKLQQVSVLRGLAQPSRGWIKTVRSAIRMTGSHLASRLGIRQQSLERIERNEITGSVSIKTMRRVAEGLDCVFVYALVPKSSLEATVRAQARKLAIRRLAQASHTMALEDQALSANENREVLERMIDEIVNDPPKGLWEVE